MPVHCGQAFYGVGSTSANLLFGFLKRCGTFCVWDIRSTVLRLSSI